MPELFFCILIKKYSCRESRCAGRSGFQSAIHMVKNIADYDPLLHKMKV